MVVNKRYEPSFCSFTFIALQWKLLLRLYNGWRPLVVLESPFRHCPNMKLCTENRNNNNKKKTEIRGPFTVQWHINSCQLFLFLLFKYYYHIFISIFFVRIFCFYFNSIRKLSEFLLFLFLWCIEFVHINSSTIRRSEFECKIFFSTIKHSHFSFIFFCRLHLLSLVYKMAAAAAVTAVRGQKEQK